MGAPPNSRAPDNCSTHSHGGSCGSTFTRETFQTTISDNTFHCQSVFYFTNRSFQETHIVIHQQSSHTDAKKHTPQEQQLDFIRVLNTVGLALHPFTALEFSADSNAEVCPGNAARAYVSSRLRLCHFDIRTVKYVRYELFISLRPLIHLAAASGSCITDI